MANPISAFTSVLNFSNSRKANNKAAGAQARSIQDAINIQQSSTDEARDLQKDTTDEIINLWNQLTPEVRELLTQSTNAAVEGQQNAADRALGLFDDATQRSVDTFQSQNQLIQDSFAPYANAGASAVQSQADLAGINGPDAQAAAISQIENDPAFQAQVRQGENAILQNASATGGLRGGNVQRALSQYRPQVLNNFINNQYTIRA